MKRKIILIFMVFIILISVGCTAKITEGEVIEKEFTPAHNTLMVLPLTVFNGKTTTVISVPYMYHYSDKWEITIQDWDKKENKMVTATYRVTEEVYNVVEIGDGFIYDEEFEPNCPEYTRQRIG